MPKQSENIVTVKIKYLEIKTRRAKQFVDQLEALCRLHSISNLDYYFKFDEEQ